MKTYFKFLALLIVCGAFSNWASAQVTTEFVNAQTGTSYTFLNTDCSKLVTFSNASATAVTLPQAGTNGLTLAGCFIDVTNLGGGTVTITPTTSTIGGNSSVILTTAKSIRLVSDGTNYQLTALGALNNGQAACTATGASPQTCNSQKGLVTTGTLTTAAATATTYTINNSSVTASSVVLCELSAYSGTYGTAGWPLNTYCTAGAGTITVGILNANASNALNGTLAIAFTVN